MSWLEISKCRFVHDMEFFISIGQLLGRLTFKYIIPGSSIDPDSDLSSWIGVVELIVILSIALIFVVKVM